MGIFLGIVKVLLILAAALFGLIYFFQSKLIFFPQKIADNNRKGLKDNEIVMDSRGCRLHGWFIKKSISSNWPLIIYYGGNAEEVSSTLLEMETLLNASFLFMNYRGYGDSSGHPSEKDLLEDALNLFDQTVADQGMAPSNIILMGRSLGTGVAVHVASKRKVSALILVTPFDSLTNVAKNFYPLLPVEKLLRHRFDSLALAHLIDTPMLAVIAEKDEIIPNQNSLNLVNAWGGPSETLVVKEAGHNDISMYDSYWSGIRGFVEAKTNR